VVQGPETSATILDNELLRGGPIALFGDAVATVKDNVLSDGPHLFIQGHGAGTEIVGNTVNGTLRFGLNVHLREPLIVAGNSFSPGGSSSVGIRIKSSQEIPAEGTFVVEDNVVDGGSSGGTGINVESGDGVEVRGNTVTNSRSGVIWGRGDGTLEGNTTTGSAAGLTILGGSPVLTSNTSCDNTGSNLFVAGSATPEIGENDFCPEPVAD
jgi:parallel beta-helix repeat protein